VFSAEASSVAANPKETESRADKQPEMCCSEIHLDISVHEYIKSRNWTRFTLPTADDNVW